jgi:ribonuclease BN (tRNA processing enzyme)
MVTGVWGMPDLIPQSFDYREYDPSEVLELGPLKVSFQFVPHYIDAWAIEVTGSSGGRFVFGADCRPNEELVGFAEGADVLLAEATLLVPEPDPDDRGHLTPFEAGEHARDAGVDRLVLTHISDEVDPDWATASAAEAFSGRIDVAFEGMRLDV